MALPMNAPRSLLVLLCLTLALSACVEMPPATGVLPSGRRSAGPNDVPGAVLTPPSRPPVTVTPAPWPSQPPKPLPSATPAVPATEPPVLAGVDPNCEPWSELAAEHIQWVGELDSLSNLMAIEGHYAYFGTGTGMVIADVSDPVHPVVIGATEPVTRGVSQVVIAGPYAYAASGFGLRIYDISTPEHPVEVGSYTTWTGAPPAASGEHPGVAMDVAVSGTTVYLAAGQGGLRVLDAHDPAHPVEVGAYDPGFAPTPQPPPTPGTRMDMPMSPYFIEVALAGRYAYVVDQINGLRIIDVSDPAHPFQAGYYDTPGEARGVAIVGTYAYVADLYSLRIVDIADPTHPVDAGSFNEVVLDVTAAGPLLYVAGESLSVLEGAGSPRPVQIAAYPGPATHVTTVGNLAFVAMGPNPSHAESRVSTGLHVFDVSDPAHATELAAYTRPNGAQGIARLDRYAYVTDLDGLHIVDSGDPLHPREIGFVLMPEPAQKVAVADGYAYVAAGTSGLHILDVHDPAHPREIAVYAFPVVEDTNLQGFAVDVALQNQYLYLAAQVLGVRILDVSDPAHPREVGAYLPPKIAYPEGDTWPGSAVDIAVVGRYVYVAAANQGLRIVDVSDPAQPVEVGYFVTEQHADGTAGAQAVAVVGQTAYLADGAAGLHILDVSDPAQPVEAGRYCSENMTAVHVAPAGRFVFVAGWFGGVFAIDVADPAHPTRAGFYPAFHTTTDVAAVEPYLYVTDVGMGLTVMQFTP